MDDLEIVRAGMPRVDECPVLTRLSAFVVAQGTTPTLEHTFRLRNGKRADLSGYLPSAVSASTSQSEPLGGGPGSVTLRVKEWLGAGPDPRTNPIWDAAGYAEDSTAGLLRAQLPAAVTERPGIYELAWGVFKADGSLVGASQALLSVERSLFPTQLETLRDMTGCLTLGEIRMAIMDEPAANLLLDDVEFSDAQILQAIAEPVRQWNETPPPIEVFTTRSFPFRGAWLSAVSGRLHIMAANHYRRNVLQAQAGGLSVPDKDKEREYMAEGQRLLDQYTSWLTTKKISINMRKVAGAAGSLYAARTGW